MSTDTDRLMANLMIRLPGAVLAAIQFEYFSVVNEFLQDTNLWKQDITFAVDPTDLSYSITPTSGVINRLMYVLDSNGVQRDATMSVPGTIVLPTYPATADTWTATVATTITDPVSDPTLAGAYPDWILNKYNTDLQDGVLGRMMSQKGKPYSDSTLAVFHMRSYKGAIAQARAEGERANLYGAQRWRFPSTFNRVRTR